MMDMRKRTIRCPMLPATLPGSPRDETWLTSPRAVPGQKISMSFTGISRPICIPLWLNSISWLLASSTSFTWTSTSVRRSYPPPGMDMMHMDIMTITRTVQRQTPHRNWLRMGLKDIRHMIIRIPCRNIVETQPPITILSTKVRLLFTRIVMPPAAVCLRACCWLSWRWYSLFYSMWRPMRGKNFREKASLQTDFPHFPLFSSGVAIWTLESRWTTHSRCPCWAWWHSRWSLRIIKPQRWT